MLLIQLPKSSSGRLASAAFIWQPLVEDVFKFGATPQVLESQWSRPSLDLWSKQEIITVTCYNSCYCILYIYMLALFINAEWHHKGTSRAEPMGVPPPAVAPVWWTLRFGNGGCPRAGHALKKTAAIHLKQV